jgi:hypothetical protein
MQMTEADDDACYSLAPEQQALLDYQVEANQIELSNRMNDIESNGLYVRNLLNHMNDKLLLPATNKVMPAVQLAMSSVGTVCTLALGVLFVIAKLR